MGHLSLLRPSVLPLRSSCGFSDAAPETKSRCQDSEDADWLQAKVEGRGRSPTKALVRGTVRLTVQPESSVWIFTPSPATP